MLTNTKSYDTAAPQKPHCLDAALKAYETGFTPIPVLPGTKQTAVKWDPWLTGLSTEKIRRHWQNHPDHELGILLGDDIIVYDADTSEGVAALYELEKSLELTCNLIIGTARGEHHYFRRAKGTSAKSDAPDKNDHPERVDTKTGRALVVAPPSTGKNFALNEIENVADLTEINQDQIDAMDRHNGRSAQINQPERIRPQFTPPIQGDLSEAQSLLKHLDPDMGYKGWLRVEMAICHHSNGSDEGLALFDEWSSGGSKYPGFNEIETKWRSLDIDRPNPVTLSSLYKLVEEALGEEKYREIQSSLGPQWDLSGGDTVVTPYSAPEHMPLDRPEDEDGTGDKDRVHILRQYSLQGKSAEFEANAYTQIKILGDFALLGQWTVIYSAPNCGKTLVTTAEVVRSIKSGIINPANLYYINADDDYSGLTTKLKLAEEYGFHMLAPGHNGFESKMLPDMLKALGDCGDAAGIIIIIDTLKKFTETNDKKQASAFGRTVRDFISKGGTLIALSHTNKNPGTDGKPKFGGTSDIVDDADCVYTLQTLDEANDVRTIEFSNIKARGNVTNTATYQYSIAPNHGYREKLASVTHVKPLEVAALKETIEADKSGDTALIEIVKACISKGVNTKTTLCDEVAERGNVGKRRAAELIEKYTGTDPIRHHWNYKVGNRGVQTFSLLSLTSPDPTPPQSDEPEDS